MFDSDKERFGNLMHAVAEVYDKPLSDTKLSIYWEDLKDFNFFDIRDALRKHRKDPKAGQYMPKPADVVKFIRDSKKPTATQNTKCNYCNETKYVTNQGRDGHNFYVCVDHFYPHSRGELSTKKILVKHNPLYAGI